MGRGYVIEHCVSTLNSIRKEENYRVYLTDVLRVISKGVGYEIKLRYADFIKETESSKEAEERTPDEIINTIRAKAELINNGSTEFIS